MFIKNSISFLIFLSIINSVYSQKEEIKNANSLKIISYNIWNGFDRAKDIDRKKNMGDWVVLQNPDVVVLQELNGYTKEKLLQDAKKWGHNYAEIVKITGYPVGITSNKPIEVKEK